VRSAHSKGSGRADISKRSICVAASDDAGEDGVGQVIKVFVTSFAVIALPFLLALMHPATADVLGLTPNALDAFGPTHLPDTSVALCIVYQIVDLEHFQSMLFSISFQRTGEANRDVNFQI
jgi:hypothetical protein